MTAWSPLCVKDKELLGKVQHRLTRMIPGFADMQYAERLEILGLMTLEVMKERRSRVELIQMCKMSHGLSDPGLPFNKFFKIKKSGRTKGHPSKW